MRKFGAVALSLLGLMSSHGAQAGASDRNAASKVRIYTSTTLPGFTIVQPSQLPAEPMPVVLWSNGGCTTNNERYIPTLSEIAARGFLVVALGNNEPLPKSSARLSRTLTERMANIPPPSTKTADLFRGLDWSAREASRPGGPLLGKIRTDRVAMMGHSCGGMHALEASLDPRVTTTVVWSSGHWRYGGSLPGIALDQAMLQRLHAPVLYLTGGANDIAHLNAEGDFYELNQVPVFKAVHDSSHGLSFADPKGGIYAPVGLAWLMWQLKDDQQAARMFKGSDCTLCASPDWKIEKKRIDN